MLRGTQNNRRCEKRNIPLDGMKRSLARPPRIDVVAESHTLR